jgi:hypothetical protein
VIFYFILKKFGLIFLIKQNKNPTHPPKKNWILIKICNCII